MESKVSQKYKIENRCLNINNLYTMFKVTLMLITEASKRDEKKNVFTSLNVINGKTYPCISRGIIRHYHYRSDTKLCPGIVAIRIIPRNLHACTTILSISWY